MTALVESYADTAAGGSLHWQSEAACADPRVDPALFFGPDDETLGDRRLREGHALLVCRRCPVVDACLEYADDEAVPMGVWGGLTEAHRLRRADIAMRLRSA